MLRLSYKVTLQVESIIFLTAELILDNEIEFIGRDYIEMMIKIHPVQNNQLLMTMKQLNE